MSGKRKNANRWAAKTLDEVAEFFGMQRATMRDWRAKGMPGRSGAFHLNIIAQWLRAEGPWRPRPAGSDPMLEDGDTSPALERYRNARADLAELDVAARCGQLVDLEALHQVHTIVSGRHRKAAEQLQREFGPRAHDIVSAAVDDAQREVERFFESLPGDDGAATA